MDNEILLKRLFNSNFPDTSFGKPLKAFTGETVWQVLDHLHLKKGGGGSGY
jgi:hypothetical protein